MVISAGKMWICMRRPSIKGNVYPTRSAAMSLFTLSFANGNLLFLFVMVINGLFLQRIRY